MTFEQWKEYYALVYEPNYSKATEADCLAAWKAGQEEMQQQLAAEQADNSRLRGLLTRYLNEVPLGHQPYMIAHEVAATLTKHPDDTALREWGARLLRSAAAKQGWKSDEVALEALADQLRSGDWKP